MFDCDLKSSFSISLLFCWVVVTSGLAQTDQQIYTDSLQNNWQDWSWDCADDLNNKSVVHSGANAISVTLTAAWGAFSLEHAAMDTSPYTNLSFWISGGPTGGQQLQLAALLGGTVAGTTNLGALTSNSWQQVTVSLAALGVGNQPNFARFGLQDRTGGPQAVFYLDDITLVVIASAPAITTQPQSCTNIAGTTATFTVSADGSVPLTYQWFKNATNTIAEGTNAVLSLSNVQSNDMGSYSVLVTNPYGSATSGVATVTVVFPPTIAQQPQSWTVVAGTVLNLGVSATGTAPLSYQWLNSSGQIAGATNATFTLNPAQTNNADGYFVVVTNLYGVVTSEVAMVTVYVPVSITTQPASQVVSARSTVWLSVVAGGYPAPAYQWAFGGTNLPGATLSTLTITNVLLPNMGNYAVLVGNGYSSQLSATATLSMSPSITAAYSGAIAIWGRSAVLSVGAIGTGELSYQWFKDGVAIPLATNQTYELPIVQLGDGGFYSVVVSSGLGSITNSAQLVVNPANMDLGMYAGIVITGAAGYRYEIQYTTDLRDTNAWVTLTNLTLQQPVELWVDTSVNAATKEHRYYRILPGP